MKADYLWYDKKVYSASLSILLVPLLSLDDNLSSESILLILFGYTRRNNEKEFVCLE